MKIPFRYKLLIAWGSFWTLTMAISMGEKGIFNVSDMLAGLLLGVLPLGYAIYRIRFLNKKRIKQEKDWAEKQILQIARQKSGLISVVDVAQTTNLSLDMAQKELDDLVKRGFADYEVKQNGSIFYRFFMVESSSPSSKRDSNELT